MNLMEKRKNSKLLTEGSRVGASGFTKIYASKQEGEFKLGKVAQGIFLLFLCNSKEKTSHYEDFAMTRNLGRKYCQKPGAHVMKKNLVLIFWHYLVSYQRLSIWKY